MTHFCYCDNSDLHDTTCKQLMICWHDTELRMGGGSTCPVNILVVCHTVMFTFTLAICSLHHYDYTYCLDLVHVVVFVVVFFLFYVPFFTLPVHREL